MAITSKTIGIIGALLGLLGLAGCISATPTVVAPTSVATTFVPPTLEATIDTTALRTEVAETVFAQVTRDLALTLTPPPTATLSPSSTQTRATTASSTGVAGVTATPSSSTPEAGTGNKAEWVAQSIADKTVFAPGETFTMTWSLKNTGTTTWTPNYILRFFGGDPFGSPEEVPVNREVSPGETVDIILQMKAPENPGTYNSVWVMATSERSNFKEPVNLEIVVAIPVTPTPTQ